MIAEVTFSSRWKTSAVAGHAGRDEERRWVSDIEGASSELDAIFLHGVVPAVLAGNRREVQARHADAQEQVAVIQERTDRLVEGFEQAIDELQAHVSAIEHATFRWTLVLIIGAPLLAAAVGVYIGRSVTRPVAKLQQGAVRIAAGDLDTRIELDTPDEFGALARRFNAMTASLKDHQEKLVQHEKLAGIGRLAAGVAHEINNPLGVILGYVRIMKKRADASLTEDLGIVEDETLRCKEIVEGLLDLSRPLRAEAHTVDLRELCEDVIARLQESKRLEGVNIAVRGDERNVGGHPQKLRQVVVNLIANAAEAAGEGGRVEVSLDSSGRGVSLSVADDGPGLSAAARERLFEPFFTTKPTGTGLGLAVSKAIVEAHGGRIEAGHSALGGAVFTVQLPEPERQAA